MTAAVVETRGVYLWRGQKKILQDVNWRVEEGQNWVIFGPNGAGKTCLVNMLVGQLYPSRGEIDVLGSRLGKTEVLDLRQRIGYASATLFDQIPPEEEVRKVILTAAWGMTASWREEYESLDQDRATALMQMFEVAQLADKPFHTLSQGERQRVMVARALMIDPELLVLDEPATALDLAGRELLLTGLTELGRDSRSPAMIMVTHRPEEIPAGFTHALLLSEGRVHAAGTLEEVLRSDLLTEVFGMPLVVSREDGRWWARSV